MNLSKDEIKRYARHLALPEVGIAGQEKLKAAKVLVVGAGGLGSPALLYLAAAGIGRIGVVDHDVVEISNLQRQVLFDVSDLGKQKAVAAKEKLLKLNPLIQIDVYPVALNVGNALEILEPYDVVIDGTDNFSARFLINDVCVILGKPLIHAAILRFEGQLSVFNYLQTDGGRGPHYRDVFPDEPAQEDAPDCATAGVMGALPGIFGAMQAAEAIKIITGVGEPLSGKLFMMDTASFTTRFIKIKKTYSREIAALTKTEHFFLSESSPAFPLREITPEKLIGWRDRGEPFQLVDVREPYEYEAEHIGGHSVPLSQLEKLTNLIDRTAPVVVHCKSGARSAQAIRLLTGKFGFDNLYQLQGGMDAYLKYVIKKER